MSVALDFTPLTPERWDDFETLFGERGACGGCWCMWFRLTTKEFEERKGAQNREAMRELVDAGATTGIEPGILAYHEGRPVGWCSVAPREEFPRLARSRLFKPVDDVPVWSVVCVFVDKGYRRQSVSTALLRAACEHVRDKGGSVVEGYAVQPRKKRMSDTFAYHGLHSAYVAAGFDETARPSETRAIMRAYL